MNKLETYEPEQTNYNELPKKKTKVKKMSAIIATLFIGLVFGSILTFIYVDLEINDRWYKRDTVEEMIIMSNIASIENEVLGLCNTAESTVFIYNATDIPPFYNYKGTSISSVRHDVNEVCAVITNQLNQQGGK
jgi:hypothetical protein